MSGNKTDIWIFNRDWNYVLFQEEGVGRFLLRNTRTYRVSGNKVDLWIFNKNWFYLLEGTRRNMLISINYSKKIFSYFVNLFVNFSIVLLS